MEKLNCMYQYDDASTRRLQVLYLYHKLGLPADKVAEIVGYAVTTVKQYLNKYAEKLQEALDLFFYKIRTRKGDVQWKCEEGVNDRPSAYVCEIYNDNERLFLKIGYSSKIVDRMYAHSTNKRYGGNRVVVSAVYYFDTEEQALSMENLLRKYYKEKGNEEDFVRKDRFTKQKPTKKDLDNFEMKAKFIQENF